MTDTLRIAPRTTRITLETPAGSHDFTLREMSLPERKAYQQVLQRFQAPESAAEQYRTACREVVCAILQNDGECQAVTLEPAWLDALLQYPTAIDRLMDLQADLNTPAGPIGALIFTIALQQALPQAQEQQSQPPPTEPAS